MLIEIGGGIASGKTTLARLLSNNGFCPILENFQSNPFWEAFYSNPSLFAFETEITFLLQHYSLIKVRSLEIKKSVCDFSLLLDAAYADVTLEESQFDVFEAIFKHVSLELGTPNLVIFLRCDPKIELQRIQNRNRKIERGIKTEFLSALNNSIERRIENAKPQIRILEIDSNHVNFAYCERDQKNTIRLVNESLNSASEF